ncbi:MAG: shikimate kinase [Acholeplasmataceae bacterium]
MNLFLIGLPGSGKSAIARALSKKLNYTYIDLDGLIEKKALMFIDAIFEKHGEATFRQLETEMLKSLVDVTDSVISCGGGVVLNPENKTYMQGTVIYIDTELDTIKERLKTDYKRPILQMKSLETLYDERFLKYMHFADIIIANDHELDTSIENIINRLKEKNLL